MQKGRVTIPTDKDFADGTRKIMARWGADAVRDCDGTELPENVEQFGAKVYKTYFLARGNNAWAYAHDEALQNIALSSEFVTAVSDTLNIDPVQGYFSEQVAPNEQSVVKYWQVFDRTTGKEIKNWKYDADKKAVCISNAIPMHVYSVNFFAKSLWDATQIYNYTCNGWTCIKDRDIDPVYDDAKAIIAQDLETWLKANPQVDVVRFTTFFYHFFLVRSDRDHQKYFDWFGYPTSASPAMFEMFEQKYGYKISLEDIVDNGYYNNTFRIPTPTFKRYMELVEEFVCMRMKEYIDIVHAYGKEAMMFLGDNWIGGEPYGKHFSVMNLDAVVGSVNSGATVRMLSEIPYVCYREARLLPYFFPDTLNDNENSVRYLMDNWIYERRAILRKPVDRIGFGGYLALAAKFPAFVQKAAELCDEFREIYATVDNKAPYCAARVAILNAWGKKRTWMNHMVCQDAPYQKILPYQGVLEALSGLPLQVDFIDFDDVRAGNLDYDVIFNYGDRDTAFTGGDVWLDETVVTAVRKFVYNGGGFIGIGEPASAYGNGRFFQLSDVLGVEEENGLSLLKHKWNYSAAKEHFITEDISGPVSYNGGVRNIYAMEGATVLDILPDENMGIDVNAGHIAMAVNIFGKGRSFYMRGFKFDSANTRLLYRAILWCSGKEDILRRAFSSDISTECHYYPQSGAYAVANNSDKETATVFYDINGKAREIILPPYGVRFIR